MYCNFECTRRVTYRTGLDQCLVTVQAELVLPLAALRSAGTISVYCHCCCMYDKYCGEIGRYTRNSEMYTCTCGAHPVSPPQGLLSCCAVPGWSAMYAFKALGTCMLDVCPWRNALEVFSYTWLRSETTQRQRHCERAVSCSKSPFLLSFWLADCLHVGKTEHDKIVPSSQHSTGVNPVIRPTIGESILLCFARIDA